MVLRGLKNFAKSIKYYFTPLGMITIFTTIGLTVALTGIFGAVKELFTSLAATIGEANVNWGDVGNSIWGSITSLNWDLTKLLSIDWIVNTLKTALAASGLGDTVAEAGNSIVQCGTSIIRYLVIFLVLFLVGLIVGYILLYFQVRGGIMKTKWWQTILHGLFDTTIQIAMIVVFILLIRLWNGFIFIIPLVGLLLSETISVVQGYLLHGYKKIAFKEVFKFKTVVLCTLSDAIIFVSGIITIVLLALIINPIIGIVIGLPLLEIAIIVSRLSAESYVVDKISGEYDREVQARKERRELRREKRLAKQAKSDA